jgi:hypothetical protein
MRLKKKRNSFQLFRVAISYRVCIICLKLFPGFIERWIVMYWSSSLPISREVPAPPGVDFGKLDHWAFDIVKLITIHDDVMFALPQELGESKSLEVLQEVRRVAQDFPMLRVQILVQFKTFDDNWLNTRKVTLP